MGSPSGPLQSDEKASEEFMHIYLTQELSVWEQLLNQFENKYELGKYKATFYYYKSLLLTH